MDRIVDLSAYLPTPFNRFKEYKKICSAENPEFQFLWRETDTLLDRTFLQSSDLIGIERFEAMMGIVPIKGDDVSSRRLRLVTKWMTARPFTYLKLQEILSGLCGNDGFGISLDGYNLTVRINLAVRNQEEIVYQMLQKIVPANISLSVTLLYNTWEMFNTKTWNQVATFSWENLKEGIIT